MKRLLVILSLIASVTGATAKPADKQICRLITYNMAGHLAHYRVCWIPSTQTWTYTKLDPYAW